MVTADPTDESGARAESGDFAALVAFEYESSMRFAMRMLRHRADAEDAVQNAFLRATQSRRVYDSTRSFHAWLFRILVNQCRTTLLQRQRRAKWFPFIPDHAVDVPDPRDGPDTLDEPFAAALASALDSLEPLLREAFLLKYVEQMDYVTMAGVTGASVSALKMRVKRAVDRLRPQLEDFRDE